MEPITTNLDTTTTTSLPPQSAQNPNPTSNEYSFYQRAPSLATSRYNRQLLIPQIGLTGQQRIASTKVLIIGLGGLGSPASLYLAGAGVHTLGLLDDDVVEESNLHRQIVHRESSLYHHGDTTGATANIKPEPMSKVSSAMRGCLELNSHVNYIAHEVRINGANALDIIRDYDVVLDCTDNPATRYLISDCCVVLGKTLVSGAAQKLDGQLVVLNWPVYGDGGVEGSKSERNVVGRGPCYRCVFPHPPSPDMVKSCSEIGILGPVVGAIGTMMASETLRLIVRDGREERKPTMLLYNAWPSDPRSMFRVIGLRGRRSDCVVCGEDDVLKTKGLKKITRESIQGGSMDYESWCGMVEDVNLLQVDQRVSAGDFLAKMGKADAKTYLVVDVREELEVELGPKIDGSINIPISGILRGNSTSNDGKKQNNLEEMVADEENRSVYFVCQRGNDSQIAAQKLIDLITQRADGDDVTHPSKRRWIGDVRGGFVEIDRITQPG